MVTVVVLMMMKRCGVKIPIINSIKKITRDQINDSYRLPVEQVREVLTVLPFHSHALVDAHTQYVRIHAFSAHLPINANSFHYLKIFITTFQCYVLWLLESCCGAKLLIHKLSSNYKERI